MDFTTPKQGCLTYFFRQNSHCVGDMHSNQNNKIHHQKTVFLAGFFFGKGGVGGSSIYKRWCNEYVNTASLLYLVRSFLKISGSSSDIYQGADSAERGERGENAETSLSDSRCMYGR